MSIYVLVAIIEKRMKIEACLYTIIYVQSVTIFYESLNKCTYRISLKNETINNDNLCLFIKLNFAILIVQYTMNNR